MKPLIPLSVRTLTSSCLFLCCSSAAAQDSTNGLTNRSQSVANLMEQDAHNGEWVSYRERFKSSDNQWAQYEGSIYAAVQRIKIEACQIDIHSVVVDHFTGTVGKPGTGQQQDETDYELSFTLTKPIAESLEVVKARPAQLRRTTHAVCEDTQSCEVTWVRFREAEHKISEWVTTND